MPTNYDKLKALLRELFQMDQADLDFGLYRIMNAKRGEIERFLEHDLLPQVKSELARHTTLDSGAKQAELAAAIEGAQKLGVNPDAVPKVQELRAALKQGGDLDSLENEVFSHLYNFFRRYYHQGDFLSLRRYKEGVYAIPYEGEEVKLYWANHDQYYIKSTEYLRNYTFKLRDNRRVHFKVVEADTEADNNKPQGGKERRFILAEAAPVAVENGELFIRFNYQADARKQTELNAAAVAAVLGNPALMDWLSELGDQRPTEKKPYRTLLAKHLDDFTARYAFDYFIHKDLGGFLRRELDFFIKNEIMHLDDVEDEAAPKVELYLSKIKALRKIAHKFIAFLEQLENFQKRLWLKKKFVVETNYCVTLDRVPEALYPEVAANEAQRAEWVSLFAIDEIKASTPAPAPAQGELIATRALPPSPGYTVPLTVEFLKANPFLVLDTKFFSAAFTSQVLAFQSNLAEGMSGLLFCADNHQALGLVQLTLRKALAFVYIDPPYNTGGTDFLYKDNYQHASWLSMMKSVSHAIYPLLADGAPMFTSVDDKEYARLAEMLGDVFHEQAEATIIRVNPSTKSWAQFMSTTHDYCVVHLKNPESVPASRSWSIKKPYVDEFKRRTAALLRMQIPDEEKRAGLRDLARIPMFKAFDHYVEFDKRGVYRSGNPNRTLQSEGAKTFPDVKLIHPVTHQQCKISANWRFDQAKTDELAADHRFHFGPDHTTVPGIKNHLQDYEEMTPQSVMFDDTQVDTKTLLPGMGLTFDFPKPVSFVRRLVELGLPKGKLGMDAFGGSGTTAHAIIDLNYEDGGDRKYLLVESAKHFGTTLKPRIQKLVYSRSWADSKPVGRAGCSHMFKYLQLESYEDCLNNLELKRTQAQDDLLTEAKDFREDYTLRYMLDVETRGSASLLNVQQFTDPFSYQLQVSTGTVGETKAVKVDLVETFNWLVGLTVKHMDHIRSVRVVEGTNPQGDRVLILWRNVAEVPNDKLDEWFKAQGYNTRDQEYDLIYVNGDNHLENFRRTDQTWKVRPIEEDFHRFMWECHEV